MKGHKDKDGKFHPHGNSSSVVHASDVYSNKVKSKPIRTNPYPREQTSDVVSRKEAQDIFVLLKNAMQLNYPKVKPHTVMLSGGIHQTVWENKNDVLLEAKFFDRPNNKVQVKMINNTDVHLNLKNCPECQSNQYGQQSIKRGDPTLTDDTFNLRICRNCAYQPDTNIAGLV